MSVYRHTIRNGVMIREKRGWILRWRWKFNRSEENYLTEQRNLLVTAKDTCFRLRRSIPLIEQNLVEVKKVLAEQHGGTSPPFRDGFTFRKEPKRIKEPKKKLTVKKPIKRHPDEGVIAKITTVHPKPGYINPKG